MGTKQAVRMYYSTFIMLPISEISGSWYMHTQSVFPLILSFQPPDSSPVRAQIQPLTPKNAQGSPIRGLRAESWQRSSVLEAFVTYNLFFPLLTCLHQELKFIKFNHLSVFSETICHCDIQFSFLSFSESEKVKLNGI